MKGTGTAVADIGRRHEHDEPTLEGALKKFGLHDGALRAWVMGRLDDELHEIPRFPMMFWTPPSSEYVAVGCFYEHHLWEDLPSWWAREAIVRAASIQFADHDRLEPHGSGAEGSERLVESLFTPPSARTEYRWRTVPFPDRFARRGERPAPSMCPTCFMQMPASGVCDYCG